MFQAPFGHSGFVQILTKTFWLSMRVGWTTDAFTWPSLLRYFSKCLLNLSTWEQPLLPVSDVLGMGWVIKLPSQGVAAEMVPKTYDPTYSSW